MVILKDILNTMTNIQNISLMLVFLGQAKRVKNGYNFYLTVLYMT